MSRYCVSEELSSVETLLHECCKFTIENKFQKNLVVWKLNKPVVEILSSLLFQKNLVVWKLKRKAICKNYLPEFQKDLIVWKLERRYLHQNENNSFRRT